MLERQLSDAIAGYEFGDYRIPLNADSCFHTDFADMPNQMRFASAKDYDETFRKLDKIVGLKLVAAFHLNDSKKDLGSRVDRHEHIGKGKIGL